ncbi:MAG: helix-turn-helix transcriptional regulator [Planctomycetaceae bacterium]|nr:helix-turn-helix transcriptional regulator [Planctomycetaceae bacterium]
MSRENLENERSPDRIGGRIRRLRQARGLNVGELGRRASVSRTALYQLEKGQIERPHAATMDRLAAALGVEPNALWGEPRDALEVGNSLLAKRIDEELRTNPAVRLAREDHPEWFLGWSETDWLQLASARGTGGELTEAGVRREAERISRRREVLKRAELLMATHLADSLSTIVNALYETVQVADSPKPSTVPSSLQSVEEWEENGA